ncbi:MAG: hypothetical protein NVS3B3_19430 [Aquirhabdus sp.]
MFYVSLGIFMLSLNQRLVFSLTKARPFFMMVAVMACGTVMMNSSWAAAEVSVPENVIVLGVDGQETGNTGLFSRKHSSFQLPAGEHTIMARYDRLFQINGDDFDVVRSKGVTIKVVLQDQQSYVLGWLPEPTSHEEALAFVKQPTLKISTTSGQVVASQQGAVLVNTSLLGGVMQGINHLTSSGVAPQVRPLDALKSQWAQASAEDKKQFQLWIQQQAPK